ncbi:MAG: Ni/Fe hydrogenase subunit alpha [Candidatus Hadarchaeales archaeon]
MREILVEHLARVEGHGNIRVVVDKENVREVKMEILEGPRFIEKILVGRSIDEAPDIVARICSICPDPHSVACVNAIEKAIGFRPSEQTRVLRELQLISDVISSHALHLFLLALPDFLGYPDAISMVSKYGKEVALGLKVKKAGNVIKEVLTGRSVHGCTVKPGGYTRVPTQEELEKLEKSLAEAMDGARLAVDLFASFDLPEVFREENMFMAVDPGEVYGFSGEHILISNGERRPVENYRLLTNERVVPHSTAKHSYYQGESFMVGALARILLNRGKLKGEAVELADRIWEKLDPKNPLANNLAQALELVYSVERAIELIEWLLDHGIGEPRGEMKIKAGMGVAAVEAPRGILYHFYEVDGEGKIARADIVTPTAQNAANIEKYLRISAQRLLERGVDNLEPHLEMLVRAYDPCISCSAHLVRVVRLNK